MRTAIHAAEALYKVRCLTLEKLRGLSRSYAAEVELELRSLLLSLGHQPGETTEDADALKLRLMRCPVPDGYGDGSLPRGGRIEAVLEATAAISGSESQWRELERFTLFCSRMRFAGPRGIIEDDTLFPVYPWCRANGRQPATDVAEAAELYQQWTEEALACFMAERATPSDSAAPPSQSPGTETPGGR